MGGPAGASVRRRRILRRGDVYRHRYRRGTRIDVRYGGHVTPATVRVRGVAPRRGGPRWPPPGESPPGESPPGESPPGESPPGESPPGDASSSNAETEEVRSVRVSVVAENPGGSSAATGASVDLSRSDLEAWRVASKIPCDDDRYDDRYAGVAPPPGPPRDVRARGSNPAGPTTTTADPPPPFSPSTGVRRWTPRARTRSSRTPLGTR